MRNTARQTRENRTITVDFRSEALLPAARQDVQTCSETSSVFIIRPTAQRYGVLVIISWVIVVFGEVKGAHVLQGDVPAEAPGGSR